MSWIPLKGPIGTISWSITPIHKASKSTQTRLQETSEGIASNEADLAAATEVRGKEAADFKSAEKELLETSATVERAMSMLEKKEAKGESLAQVKGAGSLLQAVQAMMDASMIGHQDAKTLTAFLQDSQAPEPATYESKTGGVTEMLEDMLDKSKDQRVQVPNGLGAAGSKKPYPQWVWEPRAPEILGTLWARYLIPPRYIPLPYVAYV